MKFYWPVISKSESERLVISFESAVDSPELPAAVEYLREETQGSSVSLSDLLI